MCFDCLYKSIYCGYSFQLPWQVYKSTCCGYSFELPATYAIKKKYIILHDMDCNLKPTKLHDCVLIGVCAVIRSITVCKWMNYLNPFISEFLLWTLPSLDLDHVHCKSTNQSKITRGPQAMACSPEWYSHCRYADVLQHFSNPITATNEKIIIWAVLSFEEEYYLGLTVNGAWSFEQTINHISTVGSMWNLVEIS